MRTKSLIASLAVAAATTVGAAGPPAAIAAPPQATPLEKVSSIDQPGIVYLTSKFEAVIRDPYARNYVGERVFSVSYTCTGFFVSPNGHIASAGHCVDYDASVKADLLDAAARWSFANEDWGSGSTLKGAINTAQSNWKVRSPDDPDRARPQLKVKAAYGVQISGIPTGRDLPARVLGVRSFDRGDVSLLKIEAENTPALELAPAASVEIGTQVVSVGYPGEVDLVTDQTFDPSFKDGTISSVKTVDEGLRKVYETSAALAPGVSGGPTVDLQGRVVGINSFGSSADTEAFNFISPVDELVALLKDEGVTNDLGATNRLYRTGLKAYFAGDRETALESFDALLDQVSQHELGQKYRARALKLAKAAPSEDGGGLPIVLLAIALGVLAAVAVVVRVLVGRRSATVAAPAPAPQPKRRETVENAIRDLGGAALVMLTGPRAGERVALRGTLAIGRGDDTDVRLDDVAVSRRHSSLRPGPQGIELADLGSINGTTVNGVRISAPVILRHGDVVGIGGSTAEVDLGTAARRQQATAIREVPAEPMPV